MNHTDWECPENTQKTSKEKPTFCCCRNAGLAWQLSHYKCIIVWYTTFSYLGSARNIWVMAEGKQKYLWIMNLSGAILNIVLNLLLIPVYNIMGAAIASLITQIFTNVIIGFIIKPIRENNNLMIKALDIRILKNIFLKKI